MTVLKVGILRLDETLHFPGNLSRSSKWLRIQSPQNHARALQMTNNKQYYAIRNRTPVSQSRHVHPRGGGGGMRNTSLLKHLVLKSV